MFRFTRAVLNLPGHTGLYCLDPTLPANRYHVPHPGGSDIWTRTRTSTLNRRLHSHYAISELAQRTGLEPIRIVLETIMLPLHHRCINLTNALTIHLLQILLSSILLRNIYLNLSDIKPQNGLICM